MKEEWLFPNAFVPVDVETTSALIVEIKRLIDVVGGMALAQPVQEPLTDDARGLLVIEHLGPNALLHKPMSIYDAFHMGIDAAEAAHGIKETTE